MNEWHKIEIREMDDEEREYFEERWGRAIDDDEAIIYSNLPDDGQEVIVCDRDGDVWVDTFCDDYEGCYFEESGDMDIVAWMPMPEPFKPEEEANG